MQLVIDGSDSAVGNRVEVGNSQTNMTRFTWTRFDYSLNQLNGSEEMCTFAKGRSISLPV